MHPAAPLALGVNFPSLSFLRAFLKMLLSLVVGHLSQPIDFRGHDKIVLVEAVYLVSVQIKAQMVPPVNVKIRMMPFSFCQPRNFIHKSHQLCKIPERVLL